MAGTSVKAEKTAGGSAPNVLKPGLPVFGATSAKGTPFEGWVLIQFWQPSANDDGVQIQASGDMAALIARGATALTKMATDLSKPPASKA